MPLLTASSLLLTLLAMRGRLLHIRSADQYPHGTCILVAGSSSLLSRLFIARSSGSHQVLALRLDSAVADRLYCGLSSDRTSRWPGKFSLALRFALL
jgi:hypothetical protein